MAAVPVPYRQQPDALFDEARRHTRQRRGRALLAALAALALAGAAYGIAVSAGGSSGDQPGAVLASPTRTAAVVLLVDISGSMAAGDVAPTRLAATTAALSDFVTRLPRHVEVGLVAFTEHAFVVQKPTRDRTRVTAALRSLHTTMSGTDLGDAIATATRLTVDTLRSAGITHSDGHLLPGLVLLESDGAQTVRGLTPESAAAQARRLGVPIDSVWLGTREGVVLQTSVTSGTPYQARIPVPPDPIKLIPRLTGGRYFVATSAARLVAANREIAASIR